MAAERKFTIGDRVQIFWADEGEWFEGTIIDTSKSSNGEVVYGIEYDDGDSEEVNENDSDRKMRLFKENGTDDDKGELEEEPIPSEIPRATTEADYFTEEEGKESDAGDSYSAADSEADEEGPEEMVRVPTENFGPEEEDPVSAQASAFRYEGEQEGAEDGAELSYAAHGREGFGGTPTKNHEERRARAVEEDLGRARALAGVVVVREPPPAPGAGPAAAGTTGPSPTLPLTTLGLPGQRRHGGAGGGGGDRRAGGRGRSGAESQRAHALVGG